MITEAQSAKREANGFTLVEMLVSLGIFALISLAGLQLIDALIGIQARTADRGAQLAQIQRGLFLVSSDFEQLVEGPALDDDAVVFTRSSATGTYSLRYRFDGNAIMRQSGAIEQPIISGIDNFSMRYLKGDVWAAVPATEQDPSRPRAIEFAFDIRPKPASVSGPVRRIVELPAQQ